MRFIMMVGAMLAATPAFAADQFDLICKAEKYEVRYRIDLSRGEWCEDRCETISGMAGASPGMLVLQDERVTPRGRTATRSEIDRVSGAWRAEVYALGPDKEPSLRSGRCEVAPFTPLPEAKF